jgi:hypothetical protein
MSKLKSVTHKLYHPTVWIYICILIVACVLRYYQITDKGVFVYDDARMLHFTETIYSLFHNGELQLHPEFFSSAKPGSIFPFIGLALIFSPDDFLLASYTSLLGVAVVAMTMVVAKKMMGTEAAVWAGIISALSPLQIHYSRNYNAAGSLSMLFVLLTFYVCVSYLRKTTLRNAAFLGVTIGYAFTVNYSLFPYLVFLTFFTLLRGTINAPKTQLHLLTFGLGMASIPLMFEGGYRLLQMIDDRFTPYFKMLKQHKTAIIGMDEQIYFDPIFYLGLFAKYEGLFFLLAACGIFISFKLYKDCGNYSYFLIGIIASLMFISLSASTSFMVTVPRTAYSVIPLMPILAAITIVKIGSFSIKLIGSVDEKRIFAVALAIAVVGLQVSWIAPRITEAKGLYSGYKQAALWLNDNGERAVCYTHCMIYATYSNKFTSAMSPVDTQAMIKYVLVDFADRALLGKADFYHWDKYEPERSYIDRLDKLQIPVAVFENPIGRNELLVLELGIGREGWAKTKDDLFNSQIRVYLRN